VSLTKSPVHPLTPLLRISLYKLTIFNQKTHCTIFVAPKTYNLYNTKT